MEEKQGWGLGQTSCPSHRSAPPPFLKVSSLLAEGSRCSFWDLPLRATATEMRGEKKLNLVADLSFLSP